MQIYIFSARDTILSIKYIEKIYKMTLFWYMLACTMSFEPLGFLISLSNSHFHFFFFWLQKYKLHPLSLINYHFGLESSYLLSLLVILSITPINFLHLNSTIWCHHLSWCISLFGRPLFVSLSLSRNFRGFLSHLAQ